MQALQEHPLDSGEEAARQFLEQKELGNIDKARELFQKAADLGHVQAKRMLDP